ncbi:MAG: hypothetical protein ACSLEN_14100 [Candidatus Malihini olakiniferum]
MMNIANWRIDYRLGSGFAFLVLMLFVVNAFSINKLSFFHEDAKLIVNRVYPDTVTTTDLDVVNSTLVAYQRLLLVTSCRSKKYAKTCWVTCVKAEVNC